MDLLSNTIAIMGVLLIYQGGLNIINALDKTKVKWDSLEMENYKIIKKDTTSVGQKLTIKLDPKGTTEELKKCQEQIEKVYGAKAIIKDIPFSDKAEIELIENEPKDLIYRPIDLKPTQLLIGYDYKEEPIIVDMLINPHIGVTGLSNNGKSKCIELALRNNKGADIHLINCMNTDFIGIGSKRVNGNDEILEYLENKVSETTRRNKPLLIVIDEYNVLSRTKGIDKAIQDLLSQARHRNTYVICIMQLGNKEDCKFKNLFNCRLCFRSIDQSTIRAFLGCSVEDIELKQREFIIYHQQLVKGKTYLFN